MADSKYGKYIVSETKPHIVDAPWSPMVNIPTERMNRFMWLDNEVVEGAFYFECVWLWPWPGPYDPDAGPKAHKHDYDEVIGFIGTNPKDVWDLGAEVELWLEDEKHIITRTSLVFVPKGMQHCPLRTTNIVRPVLHFTAGPGKMYFDQKKV